MHSTGAPSLGTIRTHLRRRIHSPTIRQGRSGRAGHQRSFETETSSAVAVAQLRNHPRAALGAQKVAAAAAPELDTVEEPVAESEELAEQVPEE